MIVAVTGLAREARLIAGPNVRAISGGGDEAVLARLLRDAMTPDVRAVLSFGLAGALAPGWRAGDCLVATSVVGTGARRETHPGFSDALRRLTGARVGILAGSATPLASREAKHALFQASGADAVDMESHIALGAARAAGLPFAVLRAISDDCEHDLPPAALVAMKPGGGIDLVAVVASLARRPRQIPALVRTARTSQQAFASLLRCRDLVRPALLGPDFGELGVDVA